MAEKAVITFNNIARPYVSVRVFGDNGKLKNRDIFNFGLSFILEDGLPKNKTLIKKFISSFNLKDCKIDLVLSVNEVIKINTTMPLIKSYQASPIVKKELKETYPDLDDKYYVYQVFSKQDLSLIFYNYLTPKYIINFFNDLLKEMGFPQLDGYSILPSFVMGIYGFKDEDYVYIHNEEGVTHLIFHFKGGSFAYKSFKESEANLYNQYYTMHEKHYYELEKKTITKFLTNVEDLGDFGREFKVNPIKNLRMNYLSFKHNKL